MNNSLKQLAQLTIVNAVIFILSVAVSPPGGTVSKIVRTPQPIPLSRPVVSPVARVDDKVSPTIATAIPTQAKKSAFDSVSQHASQNDCWMTIEGHVYDITAYFGSHPGGDARLLAYCGKDATAAFQSKDGSGRDHSAAARAILQSFLIE